MNDVIEMTVTVTAEQAQYIAALIAFWNNPSGLEYNFALRSLPDLLIDIASALALRSTDEPNLDQIADTVGWDDRDLRIIKHTARLVFADGEGQSNHE